MTKNISNTLQNNSEPVPDDSQMPLFDEEENKALVLSENDERKKRDALLPAHHANRDFFIADIFDYALKSDQASMEAPIFSLSTKPDLSTFEWESKDKTRVLRVIPSTLGRATQMDKDVLIYLISQAMEAKNRNRADADSRRIRFTVYNYLIGTNKPTGGIEYQRLEKALRRLNGTVIETNIRTNKTVSKRGFGIIDSWSAVEKSEDDERMIAIEVVLSDWLYNAIQAKEVLTLNPNYFRLRKPLERRLYELARKHCGQQATWKISLALLRDKSGSRAPAREFRRMIKNICTDNTLPEYKMCLNEDDNVIFQTRDPNKLIKKWLL